MNWFPRVSKVQGQFAVLIVGVIVVAVFSARGQAQPPAVQSPAPASSANPSANAAQDTFRPRLPMYYAKVVDDKQRQKIYDIQRKYHPQIEALQKQLEELVAKRNAEIEAVLTPQQKAEIEKLRQEAANRRSEKASGAAGATSQSNESTSSQ